MKIGVLAIQGSVEEHLKMLKKIKNVEVVLSAVYTPLR